MKYLFKATLQKGLSYMPYGMKINEHLRKRNLTQKISFHTIKQCIKQIELLQSVHISPENKTFLELGPGWKPIFALIYRLMGAEKIILVDVDRLITKKNLLSTFDELSNNYDNIILELESHNLSSDSFINNYKYLQAKKKKVDQFDELLRCFGFDYLAPVDARNLVLADSSIDVYYSRAVLEHIEFNHLLQIYNEAHRVLKPAGLMIHLVDTDDHWSYFDKSINRLNFLRFDDHIWDLINSPIAYQNRLRAVEHMELIKKSSFKIEVYVPKMSRETKIEINKIRAKFHSNYSGLSDEELLISSFYIIAKPIFDQDFG